MAWTNPPTFVDAAVLSASQLNILSDDLEYLHGFVAGGNPGQTSVVLTSDGDVFYLIRHLHRYLHLKITGRTRVYYDATQVLNSGEAGVSQTYAVDLNPFALVAGQFYTLRVQIEGSGVKMAVYAIESDQATL
jgi:hypothetical protein